MAAVKVLARDWKLEIETGITTPTWTPVLGLHTLTFTSEKNDVDITTFDSQGANEHLVGSRNRSLSAEGYYLVDMATKARDVGQAAVEALAEKVGAESVASFRLTDPAGNVKSFSASATIGDVGGGNDEATAWGFELTISGIVSNS